VALALESATLVQAAAEARRGDVVISGPGGDSAAVRLTSSVIGELIHDSRESLRVVSFAAFGVAEVVREPKQVAGREARIGLVLKSAVGQGGTLHGRRGPQRRSRRSGREFPSGRGPLIGEP
jgi:hypothetical protein